VDETEEADREHPTSKIRSLAMGLVEIYGQALAPQGNNLKSPFSNKDCVYYKYTVEEYRQQGKHKRWVTVLSGDKIRPFYVRDETGQVLVDPASAKIDIPMDNEYSSGFGRDLRLRSRSSLNLRAAALKVFLG